MTTINHHTHAFALRAFSSPRASCPLRSYFVLRTSCFTLALILATLLTACTFSTDTVATIGPDKITRGELVAYAGSSPTSQAGALDTLAYGHLIELEARAHGITADARQVNEHITTDRVAAQGTDNFSAYLIRTYPSAALYQQNARRLILIAGLRPYWIKTTVQAATLQAIYTDTQARAQEITQKGRAGTAFDDLLKAYAPAAAQTPDVVNSQGSVAVEGFDRQLRALFGTVQIGAWSEPIPSNGQYIVLRIAAIEQRAPTARDEDGLLTSWLDSLRTVYPVTITDPAIRAAAAQ